MAYKIPSMSASSVKTVNFRAPNVSFKNPNVNTRVTVKTARPATVKYSKAKAQI